MSSSIEKRRELVLQKIKEEERQSRRVAGKETEDDLIEEIRALRSELGLNKGSVSMMDELKRMRNELQQLKNLKKLAATAESPPGKSA
jgi:hypothetical protein